MAETQSSFLSKTKSRGDKHRDQERDHYGDGHHEASGSGSGSGGRPAIIKRKSSNILSQLSRSNTLSSSSSSSHSSHSLPHSSLHHHPNVPASAPIFAAPLPALPTSSAGYSSSGAPLSKVPTVSYPAEDNNSTRGRTSITGNRARPGFGLGGGSALEREREGLSIEIPRNFNNDVSFPMSAPPPSNSIHSSYDREGSSISSFPMINTNLSSGAAGGGATPLTTPSLTSGGLNSNPSSAFPPSASASASGPSSANPSNFSTTNLSTLSSFPSAPGVNTAPTSNGGSGGGGGQGMSMPNMPSVTLGNALENLRTIVGKRVTTWRYLGKAHGGRVHWFNTVLLSQPLLLSSFPAPKTRIRAHRLTILGMSLSSLLDITSAQDFLRGLLNAFSEFENTGLDGDGKEEKREKKMAMEGKGGVGSGGLGGGAGIEGGPGVGGGVGNGGGGGEMIDGRGGDEKGGPGGATKVRKLFRTGKLKAMKAPAAAGLGTADYALGLQDSADPSFLFSPNIPFDLDYFQVLFTTCDIMVEVYRKIGGYLGADQANLAALASGTSTNLSTTTSNTGVPAAGMAGAPSPNLASGSLASSANVSPASSAVNLNSTLQQAGGGNAAGAAGGSNLTVPLIMPSGEKVPVGLLSPALVDVVLKVDGKIKKLLSTITKELDTVARTAIKSELMSIDPLIGGSGRTSNMLSSEFSNITGDYGGSISGGGGGRVEGLEAF